MHISAHTPLVFVDLETTGTSARKHRVIEIGIVRVEGGEVVREYRTFLNAGDLVPTYVTSLTGISTAMLQDAPQFEDVALTVAEVLDGALFIAHNAPFDYGFLGEEFRRLGLPFSQPYLCTAKLSRELFPEEQHHKLEAIIERYGLTFEYRHRALDDARVLLQFLTMARKTLGDQRVFEVMQEMVRIRRLPVYVREEHILGLPDSPGVYLFYGKQDELLYVGKSRKIRTRVRSHFSTDALSGRGRDMLSEIRRIEHRETASELGALLLESHLVRTRAPAYSNNEYDGHGLCVAREMLDDAGYLRVLFEQTDTIMPAEEASILAVFRSTEQARELLSPLVATHHLCPYLLGIEQHAPCTEHGVGVCAGSCAGVEKPRHYNKRHREAFANHRLKVWPFAGPVALEEKRANRSELFVVDHWRLLAALERTDGEWEEFVPARFHFEYDTYKIFAREILKKKPRIAIRDLTHTEQRWLEDVTVR